MSSTRKFAQGDKKNLSNKENLLWVNWLKNTRRKIFGKFFHPPPPLTNPPHPPPLAPINIWKIFQPPRLLSPKE